jgi:succinate dehydrogenase / fumarate reductase cytochrome b subunit
MAQAGTRNRPLSPHLQIWKWGPAMAVSILHRVTGTINAIAGLGLLLWFLGALASGPESYATFAALAGTWYGQIVLFGVTASVFVHAASGLRHFVLDIGAGYELESNKVWSVLCPLIGIVLALAFWAALLFA